MWIIVRLIVLFIGFCIRYLNLFRKRFSFLLKTSTNIAYGEIRSTHKGNLIAYYLGVPLETDVVFQISKEKDSNRILKNWGLTAEIQTGDVNFDEDYYIGSDHVHFNQALRSDPSVRTFIHKIFSFNTSIEGIYCDGHSLYVRSEHIAIPPETVVLNLQRLAEKIQPIASTSKFQSYKDPFVIKLLIFESILFALLFYAFESFIERIMFDRYTLETPVQVFMPGTLVGLAGVTILGLIFFKMFRGSARAHYILTANLVILFLGSPFWGTQSFVDLNSYLDKSPVVTEYISINRTQVREHRRKGRTSYTYHWYYRPAGAPEDSYEIDLALPYSIYHTAQGGDTVEMKTRKGAFNYKYRISINNIEL